MSTPGPKPAQTTGDPPFHSSSNADIAICTGDNVLLFTHRLYLIHASAFFRNLLSDGIPDETHEGLPLRRVPEDGSTMHFILRLSSPIHVSFSDLVAAVAASPIVATIDKYIMDTLRQRVIDILQDASHLGVKEHPFEVYALATAFGFTTIAQDAARHTLRTSISEWEIPENVASLISGPAYQRLVRYHIRCGVTAQETARFLIDRPGIGRCVCCDKVYDDLCAIRIGESFVHVRKVDIAFTHESFMVLCKVLRMGNVYRDTPGAEVSLDMIDLICDMVQRLPACGTTPVKAIRGAVRTAVEKMQLDVDVSLKLASALRIFTENGLHLLDMSRLFSDAQYGTGSVVLVLYCDCESDRIAKSIDSMQLIGGLPLSTIMSSLPLPLPLLVSPVGTDQVHGNPPFDSPTNADVVLRTSNNVLLFTYKSDLIHASPFFNHLLSEGHPEETVFGHPALPVVEDSQVMRTILLLCSARHYRLEGIITIIRLGKLASVVLALDKYVMELARQRLDGLVEEAAHYHTKTQPILMFVGARTCALDAVARKAARQIIGIPLFEWTGARDIAVLAAQDFQSLVKYHLECAVIAVATANILQTPNTQCSACRARYNDLEYITLSFGRGWALHIQKMQRLNPLGNISDLHRDAPGLESLPYDINQLLRDLVLAACQHDMAATETTVRSVLDSMHWQVQRAVDRASISRAAYLTDASNRSISTSPYQAYHKDPTKASVSTLR